MEIPDNGRRGRGSEEEYRCKDERIGYGNPRWVVAEGTEEVKGASSFPLEKAMDDCVVAYGMNGEAPRPQQGFPLRLLVPGFEGIFNSKYLRRIKVVDRYYMNYNDYGHLRRDPVRAALGYQVGPKSVITFPSGGQQLPGRGFYEVSGLAWSGGGAIRRVEVSTDGGRRWMDAEIQGTAHRMAHTRFRVHWNWDGQETELLSRCTDELGQVQPSRAQVAEHWNVPLDPSYSVPGLDNTIQPWRVASDGSVHPGFPIWLWYFCPFDVRQRIPRWLKEPLFIKPRGQRHRRWRSDRFISFESRFSKRSPWSGGASRFQSTTPSGIFM